MNMSLRSVCVIDAFCFFGKKQNFWSWGYSPQVLDHQDFCIIGHIRISFLCVDTVYPKLQMGLPVCNGSILVSRCSISQAATNSYVYL